MSCVKLSTGKGVSVCMGAMSETFSKTCTASRDNTGTLSWSWCWCEDCQGPNLSMLVQQLDSVGWGGVVLEEAMELLCRTPRLFTAPINLSSETMLELLVLYAPGQVVRALEAGAQLDLLEEKGAEMVDALLWRMSFVQGRIDSVVQCLLAVFGKTNTNLEFLHSVKAATMTTFMRQVIDWKTDTTPVLRCILPWAPSHVLEVEGWARCKGHLEAADMIGDEKTLRARWSPLRAAWIQAVVRR
jgi:hypothetical protein